VCGRLCPAAAQRGQPPLTHLAGFESLVHLALDENPLTSLPFGIFSDLCNIFSLRIKYVAFDAFDNNAFAGFPHCSSIFTTDSSNYDVTREIIEVCETEQHIFVEDSCFDRGVC
jgi:hypothetical protein